MRTRLVNLRVPADVATGNGPDTVPADILIEGEKIAAVARVDERPGEAGERRIDLQDQLVIPGAVDGHVHFDDPGFTHRENFASGTRSAAAGGVTCVVDMPCTSLPPVTCRANLEAKLAVIEPKAHVDFMLWGGVSANSMDQPDWIAGLEQVVSEGVGAIKVYMLSGMETFRDLEADRIEEVLRETRRLGIPVGVHAEDRGLVLALTERLISEGANTPLDYADSRPAAGEVSAVSTLRDLCRRTGARVHVVHVGAGEALDIIASAHGEGLPLSGETCPHFLEFTREDLAAQGALLKTAPVVKTDADRERLWLGIANGDIQHVATDHAAGEWPGEKHTGSIWTDYGGVPGVELLLPYLYSEGYRKGRIGLARLVELVASAPASFFGVDSRKGALAPGFDADLAVIDEDASWTVSSEDMHNLNRYTPFEGRTLTGRVTATFVRGTRVFNRGAEGRETFGPPGFGRRVKRETMVSP
ncbi:MAG: allantoinase AllB [Gemmatimonadetes bacterium]|nr:allantoinase AllB [Gemmatimonadota bacterium]